MNLENSIFTIEVIERLELELEKQLLIINHVNRLFDSAKESPIYAETIFFLHQKLTMYTIAFATTLQDLEFLTNKPKIKAKLDVFSDENINKNAQEVSEKIEKNKSQCLDILIEHIKQVVNDGVNLVQAIKEETKIEIQ